jgi:hypothetical protein
MIPKMYDNVRLAVDDVLRSPVQMIQRNTGLYLGIRNNEVRTRSAHQAHLSIEFSDAVGYTT